MLKQSLSRLVVVTIAPLILSGCIASSGQREVLFATPRGGKPARADIFAAATRSTDQPVAAADEVFFNPIPMISRKRNVTVDLEAERATASDYSMIVFGIPYQYLPFQFSFSRYVYEPGVAEPIGSLERRYTPFWSYARTRGDVGDDFIIDVRGIPLLAEWGYEKGPSWYFEDLAFQYDPTDNREFHFLATLWWLGPTYYDVTGQFVDGDGVLNEYDGTYLTPLLLGRAAGFLLWSSYRAGLRREGQETRTVAHGPLLGYPGYFSQAIHRADGSKRQTSLLLGGSLWYDGASEEAPGVGRNRATGPLWGLFGAGRRHDAPVVYFLRVPIRVGSVPSASLRAARNPAVIDKRESDRASGRSS